MEPLVSIILPTYNVEKYLAQCIQSCLDQTYKQLEIIVVIDGATDNSYSIAKDFESKCGNVLVVWQANAGSGPARNNGLKHAKGEYIMFVDPDDWIDNTMVEKFMAKVLETNCDLLCARNISVYYNDNDEEIGRKVNKCKKRYYSTPDQVHEHYYDLYTEHLLGAPTKKIYKMSLIKEHNIEFPDLRRSQDIVFNYRYYEHVTSVYVSDESLYYYRINKNANVLKLPIDYYKTVLYLHNGILNMYNQWTDYVMPVHIAVGLNNVTLDRIIRCLEAKVVKGENMQELLNSQEVQSVISKSSPKRRDKSILKYLILKKDATLIKVVLKSLRFLRKFKA